MNYAYSFNTILDRLAQAWGLYGVFANPGFGTTSLMMQITDEMNKRRGGTAIVVSIELSEEQWRYRMQKADLSEDRIIISDEYMPTKEHIERLIEQIKNVSVVCVDYFELLDQAVQESLRELAKKYKIPIVVCGKLTRDSGDYDPELRPELYSVALFRDANKVNKVLLFDFLALMHRKHKCDRGIGTARRYDVSNETELIIKRNFHGELGSTYMEWDEDKLKFKF